MTGAGKLSFTISEITMRITTISSSTHSHGAAAAALKSRPANRRERRILMSERGSRVLHWSPINASEFPGWDDNILYCDDKRTLTASKKKKKKTSVLGTVGPEPLRDNYYPNQKNCSSLERVRRAAGWRSGGGGTRQTGGIRTEERNLDHFGRAVTQYDWMRLLTLDCLNFNSF